LADDRKVAVRQNQGLAWVIELLGEQRDLEVVGHCRNAILTINGQRRIANNWTLKRLRQRIEFDLEALADRLISTGAGRGGRLGKCGKRNERCEGHSES
jgi:hypothetical protein